MPGHVTRLHVHAVADDTALSHYYRRAMEFLAWVRRHPVRVRTVVQLDKALADFLDWLCYVERRGIAAGRDAVSGMQAAFPDLKAHFNEAHRALQSWARLGTSGEGAPVALELVALIEKHWRSLGEGEAADALVVWADGWLRWQDIERLLVEDVMKSSDGDDSSVAILLGARARGASTRTGPKVPDDFASMAKAQEGEAEGLRVKQKQDYRALAAVV